MTETSNTSTQGAAQEAAQEAATQGVTPHLICAGAAEAIDFYKRAFGAEELIRIPDDTGRIMHACLAVNGATVMLADEFPGMACVSPKALKGTPVTIHLPVPDADALAARAVEAGATVVMPVADMFWGDRYGVLEDPFGHRWSVSTPQRRMTPEEVRAAARAAMAGCGETGEAS